MTAVFQSSSLQAVLQCFQHGKRAAMRVRQAEGSNAATEWKPRAVRLSDVSNLPLRAALRGEIQHPGSSHSGTNRRKGEWTSDLTGLQRFSFLLWKQPGPQKGCWSENWWPFWTIPAFLCLLMETVGCEMQHVQCPERLACCCRGFLLLDALDLAKYHCSRESLVPLLENPGKLRWLRFA